MGRKRRGPWQRKQDGCWYTTINRRDIKLGSADDPWEEIEQRYAAELSRQQKPSEWTVAQLIDEFLEHCSKHLTPATYQWYKTRLQSFYLSIGDDLKPNELQPRHVYRWVDRRFGGCSDSTKHGAIRCVVRVFNWAVKQRLISSSPLVGIEKPTPNTREVVISDSQFQEILTHVYDNEFTNVLVFLWETGCRPQEMRVIEARHLDNRKIVLDRQQSKGRKQRRVIWLTGMAYAIASSLAAKHPTGPIFRNLKGNPWNKNSLSCRFARLRKKTGIDGLCAYTIRHSYATRMLKSGTDSTVLGVLMGHADPSMVSKVYQHVAQDDNYMLSVIGGGMPLVGGFPPADTPSTAAG